MNISLDEIRSKAPKGATHYNQNGDYFCVLHFIFYMWNPYDNNWFATKLMDCDVLKPLN